jgi:hypothetical protein
MKCISIIASLTAMACGAAFAQKGPPGMAVVSSDSANVHLDVMAGGKVTARFGMMGPPVKGAPYSAEGSTEMSQTLGDGTHINHQESYTIYRDGEGRIRRENSDEAWISDPVAGTSYVLHLREQTAHKMPLSGPIAVAKMQAGAPADKLRAEARALSVSAGGFVYQSADRPEKVESLGKSEMEGVEVEGTRSTTLIPLGQIGNDRPVTIVHERWESPELHITILARHTDPMMGDRVERLTNVRRGEPDPALFQVPAGFQVEPEK